MTAIVQQDGSLERLLTELKLDLHGLAEYRISTGWRVSLPTIDQCGICYVSGSPCRMLVGRSSVALSPNSVAMVPAGKALVLEGPGGRALRTLNLSASELADSPAASGPIMAGDDAQATKLIYLCFRAYWGAARELFRNVQSPIVDHFGEEHPIHAIFDQVVEEYRGQQFGAQVMLTALLKQVTVMLLRRSREASQPWLLPILQDAAINRAFAEMVVHPAAQYSVETLSEKACLSRSAFMARFVAAVGAPPFVVLRELRMTRAAELLASEAMTIDQVARNVGYGSRSSFARAFRIVHGVDVSGCRTGPATPRPNMSEMTRMTAPN